MALNFKVLSAAVWNPAGTLNLPRETPFPLTVFCDENPSTKGIQLPIKRKVSVLSKSAILTATACGRTCGSGDILVAGTPHGNAESRGSGDILVAASNNCQKVDLNSTATRMSPLPQEANSRDGDKNVAAPTSVPVNILSRLPYVFASRWGEWAREINLLFERTETGIVSQGGFALSVHNTAPSLFSLTYKNRSNYTAISAGTESLEAALLQAAIWLNDHEKVLLTFGEEPPADQPGVAMKIQAGTLSLILARGNDFSLAGTQNSLAGTPISIENLLDFLAGTQKSAQSLAGTTISLTKLC